jgi:hypothetical protein
MSATRQDEADEMLSKGFKEQIYDVYRYLPPETQVVLVSATLPHEVRLSLSLFRARSWFLYQHAKQLHDVTRRAPYGARGEPERSHFTPREKKARPRLLLGIRLILTFLIRLSV